MTCKHIVGGWSEDEVARIRGNNFDIVTYATTFVCYDCDHVHTSEFTEHEYKDDDYESSDVLSRYTL